jgi:hypothetical protein
MKQVASLQYGVIFKKAFSQLVEIENLRGH